MRWFLHRQERFAEQASVVWRRLPAGCMLEDLRKDMDFLLENLLLFVARGALGAASGTSPAGRRRLEAIGFADERPAVGTSSRR